MYNYFMVHLGTEVKHLLQTKYWVECKKITIHYQCKRQKYQRLLQGIVGLNHGVCWIINATVEWFITWLHIITTTIKLIHYPYITCIVCLQCSDISRKHFHCWRSDVDFGFLILCGPLKLSNGLGDKTLNYSLWCQIFCDTHENKLFTRY